MKIAIFGSGYVGLVTGACFAEMGHSVLCVDVDSTKVNQLNKGQPTVYEPGLENVLETNLKAGRLRFTTDAKSACLESEIIFIAVGTPSSVDGSAELKHVLDAAKAIAIEMTEYKLIVTKSTVPVGTHFKIKEVVKETLQSRKIDIKFDVASNPEFLRQGHAIHDCMHANRIIVGIESDEAKTLLHRLYEPFLRNGIPFIVMDPSSSEMTKYAANVMLAAKISLMNEFSKVCEKLGADIELVREGIGTDPRIGPHSIYAGIGYGGTCFPKDVTALINIGKKLKIEMPLVTAVDAVNKQQRNRFISNIEKKVSEIKANRVAIWGLSFKPGTDDIREAPAIDLIKSLLNHKCIINCYDPVAQANMKKEFLNNSQIHFFDNQYEALNQAEILIIPTEWNSFRNPDFELMKNKMKSNIIFDGRNIYKPSEMHDLGFEYYSIGRK